MMNLRRRAWLWVLCTMFSAPVHPVEPTYLDKVGLKLGSGYTNMVLGLAEIPKNALITTNQTNALFGVTGGVFKGILHGVGRTLAGAVDLLTCPIATAPIPQPPFVWQNFETETRYGPVLKP